MTVMTDPKQAVSASPYYSSLPVSAFQSAAVATAAAASAYVTANDGYDASLAAQTQQASSDLYRPTNGASLSSSQQTASVLSHALAYGGLSSDGSEASLDGNIAGLLKAAMVSNARGLTVISQSIPSGPLIELASNLAKSSADRKRSLLASSSSLDAEARKRARSEDDIRDYPLISDTSHLTGPPSISDSHAHSSSRRSPEIPGQSALSSYSPPLPSPAPIFRKPSQHKTSTRPAVNKLFASLNLSPENFTHFQNSAKQFMLDPAHPERRNCIGNRGSGDTDFTRLRLFNSVKEFLNAGAGERFFGSHVPPPPSDPISGHDFSSTSRRQWVWPEDMQHIITLVTPVLRRAVTNERQRVYALETRKTGKRDKSYLEPNSSDRSLGTALPSSQTPSAGTDAAETGWAEGVFGSKLPEAHPELRSLPSARSCLDHSYSSLGLNLQWDNGPDTAAPKPVLVNTFAGSAPPARLTVVIKQSGVPLGRTEIVFPPSDFSLLSEFPEAVLPVSYETLVRNIHNFASELVTSSAGSRPPDHSFTSTAETNCVDSNTAIKAAAAAATKALDEQERVDLKINACLSGESSAVQGEGVAIQGSDSFPKSHDVLGEFSVAKGVAASGAEDLPAFSSHQDSVLPVLDGPKEEPVSSPQGRTLPSADEVATSLRESYLQHIVSASGIPDERISEPVPDLARPAPVEATTSALPTETAFAPPMPPPTSLETDAVSPAVSSQESLSFPLPSTTDGCSSASASIPADILASSEPPRKPPGSSADLSSACLTSFSPPRKEAPEGPSAVTASEDVLIKSLAALSLSGHSSSLSSSSSGRKACSIDNADDWDRFRRRLAGKRAAVEGGADGGGEGKGEDDACFQDMLGVVVALFAEVELVAA